MNNMGTQPRPQATPRFYLAAVEKNWEKSPNFSPRLREWHGNEANGNHILVQCRIFKPEVLNTDYISQVASVKINPHADQGCPRILHCVEIIIWGGEGGGGGWEDRSQGGMP